MAHKEFSLPNIKAAVSPAFPDDPTAKDDNEVPLDPERMRAAFSVFDTDGDGKLSEADVERILTMKVDGHTPLTKVQVARLLAKYGGHQGINCEDLVGMDTTKTAGADVDADDLNATRGVVEDRGWLWDGHLAHGLKP